MGVVSIGIFTSTSMANTPPGRTTFVSAVIELHNMPNPAANGTYFNWSFGPAGSLGWLKRNPDGSSFQLMGSFTSPNVGLSTGLKSLYLYDSKTKLKTDLFPVRTRIPWVISWVGENYDIINRNAFGTHYGNRGIPSTKMVKEIPTVTLNNNANLVVAATQKPTPPKAGQVSSPLLGGLTVYIDSNMNLVDTELRVILDDAKGNTIHNDRVEIKYDSVLSRGKAEHLMGPQYQILPNGQYTITFELHDMKNKRFVSGVTHAITKTTGGIIKL